MIPIGGFFQFELNMCQASYHNSAIALTTGRSCLSLFLKKTNPKRVYVPFYACNALYDPMLEMGVELVFYSIDKNLEPTEFPTLKPEDVFLYINYFGLKNKIVNIIVKKYGVQAVVDNTHSFFCTGYDGAYSFTSARKWFGVPDGAYLYGVQVKNIENIKRNEKISALHNLKRLNGDLEEAYKLYLEAERFFDCKIERISLLSEAILNTIDYTRVKEQRMKNFNYLSEHLDQFNRLSLSSSEDVPFCYPFLPTKVIERRLFHQERIFIPMLWPDVIGRNNDKYEFEVGLANELLPMPIDHRYCIKDMKRIVNFIRGKE